MNKRMYKLESLCVKYVPIIIAAIVLLNAILARFDLYIDELNYIAGTGFLTLIPMPNIQYLRCSIQKVAESMLEKSLTCLKLRKSVKDTEV